MSWIGCNRLVDVVRSGGKNDAHLDRGVVVILVDLLVNSGSHVLVLLLGDSLVSYCWCNLLVHGGVMVAGLVHEALNCCLGLIHFDDVDVVVSGNVTVECVSKL